MAEITYWVGYQAANNPGRRALVDLHSGRERSYAELDGRVRRLAGGLRGALGVARGDRVSVLAPNTTSVFEVQYACQLLGAVFLPLNWRLAAPELAFVLDDARPAVLVHDVEFAERARQLAAGRERLRLVAWGGEPDAYEDLVGGADPVPGPVALAPDDPWTIIYTSGTTGRPKGAIVSHRMGLFNVLNVLVAGEVGARAVGLTALPTFHTAGLNLFANPLLYAGGTVLVMRSFDPARTLALLSDPDAGVTHFCGVPANYQFVQRLPGFADAPLRPIVAAVGGSPSPRTLLEDWAARGVVLRQVYGITEGSSTVTMMPAERALEKVGSAGVAVPHAELRVVDAEGRPLAAGQVGELQVRGPNVSPGYWNRPEATAETFVDGWLRTGDAARLDDEGYCYIVDRWKDMYISGGENVYPTEVEDVIYRLAGVAEVAVVGIPDGTWGEVGLAAIVVKAGHELSAEAVRRHCAERLAGYKVPKEVRFLDALPRNAIGKVRKVDLRPPA